MTIWHKTYTLQDLNDLRGIQKDNINKHLDIRITEIGDSFVTLQVAGGVAIQVQKFQVAQLMPKGTFKGA